MSNILPYSTSDALLSSYGTLDIKALGGYFGKKFYGLKYHKDSKKVVPTLCEPVLDAADLMLEWKKARFIIRDDYQHLTRQYDIMARQLMATETDSFIIRSGISQRAAYDDFLQNKSDVFPNLCTLLRIQRVIPTNSAVNERIGSLMTLDKQKRQSSMRDDIFMSRILTHDQGPSVSNFDYDLLLKAPLGTQAFDEDQSLTHRLSEIADLEET